VPRLVVRRECQKRASVGQLRSLCTTLRSCVGARNLEREYCERGLVGSQGKVRSPHSATSG